MKVYNFVLPRMYCNINWWQDKTIRLPCPFGKKKKGAVDNWLKKSYNSSLAATKFKINTGKMLGGWILFCVFKAFVYSPDFYLFALYHLKDTVVQLPCVPSIFSKLNVCAVYMQACAK